MGRSTGLRRRLLTGPLRRPARLLWRVSRPLLPTAAFVLPVYLFVADRTPSGPKRLSLSQALSQDIAIVRVPAYRTAVPVLTYHDISDRPGRYTVPPGQFRSQMAALAATGFHTITVAQLIDFLERGAPLPPRPVLVTFDDGLGSAWRTADPVLEAYGLHAVAFVISGQLNRRGFYYLHAGELRQMIRSGRWDVEAHTHLGHGVLPVNAHGDVGPFLTDRAWLSAKHRLETVAETRARIDHDLTVNANELRSYGASPQLFAYPFSAANAPTNDSRVLSILHAIVAAHFPISFVDADAARYLDRWDGATPQQLPRFEVFAGTTTRDLLRRLLETEPLPPSTAGALRQPGDWSFDGIPLQDGRQAFKADALRLSPAPHHWQAAYYALTRSDSWQSYRLQTVISGLGSQRDTRTVTSVRSAPERPVVDDGTSASILLDNATVSTGTDAAPRYSVTVSAAHLSVTSLRPGLALQRLASVHISPRPRHTVEVELSRTRLRVEIDKQARASVPVSPASHGGIGLGVWRQRQGGQPVRFTQLTIRPAQPPDSHARA